MSSSKILVLFFLLIVAVLLGGAAGFALGPTQHSIYLELQAISDAVHRFTLVALPLLLLFAIINTLLAYFLGRRFRNLLLGLGLSCLALASGVLSYTITFDECLEERGLNGQFELTENATAKATGSPTRRPGTLLTVGDTVFVTGGGEYEDDSVVVAIDGESGRRRWSYHCLGNRIFPPAVDTTDLAIVVWRPSASSVALIRFDEPALRWAVRFDTSLTLPARFTAAGVEVIAGDDLVLLERGDGRVLNRQSACVPKAAAGVVCRGDHAVAWEPYEKP